MATRKILAFITLLSYAFSVCLIVVILSYTLCSFGINNSRILDRQLQFIILSKSNYRSIINNLLKQCKLHSRDDGYFNIFQSILWRTIDLFCGFFTEISIISITITIFPYLKGYWEFYRPQWIGQFIDKTSEIFIIDSQPPDLIPCEDNDINNRTELLHHSKPKLYIDCETTNSRTPNLSPRRISPHIIENWQVFDPVFGVIPLQLREAWTAGEARSKLLREQCIINKNKKSLPPVRYSNDD